MINAQIKKIEGNISLRFRNGNRLDFSNKEGRGWKGVKSVLLNGYKVEMNEAQLDEAICNSGEYLK